MNLCIKWTGQKPAREFSGYRNRTRNRKTELTFEFFSVIVAEVKIFLASLIFGPRNLFLETFFHQTRTSLSLYLLPLGLILLTLMNLLEQMWNYYKPSDFVGLAQIFLGRFNWISFIYNCEVFHCKRENICWTCPNSCNCSHVFAFIPFFCLKSLKK